MCLGLGVVQEHSPVHYPADEGGSQGPLCSLDNNQAHFILVEPGPPEEGDGLTELRLRLEKHISEQRTGYGGEACPREGAGVCVGGQDPQVGRGEPLRLKAQHCRVQRPGC